MSEAELVEAVAGYMATRTTPWKDEAEMRDAVRETVRLLFHDARDDTLKVLGLSRRTL